MRSRKGGNDNVAAYPANLPASERARWDELTPRQRERAVARIGAVEDWRNERATLSEAVAASGVSRSRFYRIAADWRATPSIDALGAFAGAGVAARAYSDPAVVNALQAVVGRVVETNGGAKVSELVRLMVARAGFAAPPLGPTKLRAIVTDEQRRRAATGDAGHAVRLDCVAVNLPREGGRPWIMFCCLDQGTGAILGAAMSAEPVTREGYRLAARNALDRMGTSLAGLPWAIRLARVEMTAGVDVDEAILLRDELMTAGVTGAQVAQKEKRFGQYVRATVGERIGRIAITPKRTAKGDAMPDNGDMTGWSGGQAAEILAEAVDGYDTIVLERVRSADPGRPPEDLVTMLELLAAD